MSPPKSRHSEPRKTHIPSFSLLIPVWVQPCSPGLGACASVTWTGSCPTGEAVTAVVASANGGLLGLGRCRRLTGVRRLGRLGRLGELDRRSSIVVTGRRVVVAVVVTVDAGFEAGLEAPAVDGDEHDHATEGREAEV